MSYSTEVAIVGAGPYGLSVASHLRAAGISFRIFGVPMQTWRQRMPEGMLLKSDGFASSLFDPASAFTLKHYCGEKGIPYGDTAIPVRLDTFRDYGVAFQRRMVPELEEHQVARIDRVDSTYRLQLETGETATARRVLLAVGISHFDHTPPALAGLPAELGSHSSAHHRLDRFRGRDIVVVGGGSSAVDLAVLITEAGGRVTLVSRRAALKFQDPPSGQPESLWSRLRYPSSPMGPGLASRFYSDAPGLFRHLPEATRLRIVSTHLGAAAGWPMKPRFDGRVDTMLGCVVEAACEHQGRAQLTLATGDGPRTLRADHVIAATGYRVDVRRLTMFSPKLSAEVRVVQGSPVLSSRFESSVAHLYFVGVAAANTFGPLMRFACGAGWAAGRITSAIGASRHATAPAPAPLSLIDVGGQSRGSRL